MRLVTLWRGGSTTRDYMLLYTSSIRSDNLIISEVGFDENGAYNIVYKMVIVNRDRKRLQNMIIK